MRPPVYIAGPYLGSVSEIRANVRRALALATHAVRGGFTPFVPHALGVEGVYGKGATADETALDCCLAMVHHVAEFEDAQLWAIARDDGTLSEGTQLELDTWDGAEPIVRTWAEWSTELWPVRP